MLRLLSIGVLLFLSRFFSFPVRYLALSPRLFLFPGRSPLPRGIGKNKINCSTYPIRWQSRCPGDADSLLSSMLSGGERETFLSSFSRSSLFLPSVRLGGPLSWHNFLRSSMTSERRTELGKKRVGTGPARPSRLSLSCLAAGSSRSSRESNPPIHPAASSPLLSSPLLCSELCSLSFSSSSSLST